MTARRKKTRTLKRLLKKHNKDFVWDLKGGKGNHWQIVLPGYTPFTLATKDEMESAYLKAIIRHFDLPATFFD